MRHVLLLVVCVLMVHVLPKGGYAQSDGVPLQLLEETAHDLQLQQTGPGEYEIKTTGEDPYLYTRLLNASLDSSQHVLAFEYFSASGVDDVQFFFVPPLKESRSLVRNLGVSEGWTNFSVDFSEVVDHWGRAGDSLRIDFGNTAGGTLQIRNLRLRAPTERERELAAREAQRKRFEAKLEKDLRAYLDASYPDTIRRVSVRDSTSAITGKVTESSRGALHLAEVPLHQHVTQPDSLIRAAEVERRPSGFEVVLDRYVRRGSTTYDRLLSKWVLLEETASGAELRSHARYPDEVEARWELPEEKTATKKGLGGYSAGRSAPDSDLDSLGITSVTVNIWVTEFMRSEPSSQTMPFTFNGKTYHVNRDAVEDLDATLQSAAARDLVTSAIILIGQAADVKDKKIGEIFEHPHSDPAGIYSMANVTSARGVEYYAAIMDFLAQRYSRPDEKYGRIHHWIVHNEVDAGWVWTNAGEKTPLVFMDLYHKSMRTIYYIARKYNPHAKAFISLTHYWDWTSDEHFYHSRDLLNLLLDYSGAEGDFEWAIAHHPYPESLADPRVWEDEKVDYTFSTPLITYKNIEVLDAWVKQPRTFYEGQPRTVYLSEQGLNSPDYSEEHLTEQAAGMCYAWKKFAPLSGIDAFQYHNWQDNRGEGGLRIGLRRFPDAEENPGGKKPIWHVYEALGTPREDEACAFAKEVIGIEDWSQVQHEKPIEEGSAASEVGATSQAPSVRDVKSDTWVATDALGRTLPGYAEVGPRKDNRTVGIFYFLTHNDSTGNGPPDVTDILAESPQDPDWGDGAHYWGEPESGYYLSTDRWMIRQHARLLSDAGVDVIVFDVTNNVTYPESYSTIAEVFQKMHAQGEDTPQFAFLASEESTFQLWEDLYSKGRFTDLWFRWKGKPLLMFGQWQKVGPMEEVTFPEEIRDFFTIRESWAWTSLPWYDDGGHHEWPWVDHFPQSIGWSASPDSAEYVPVAAAQHPLSNIGRSFHNFHQPATGPYDLTPYTDQGLYFGEQWSRALEVEPEFVFVTGWNEWGAGKQVMDENIQESLMFWDFYPGAHLGKAGEALDPGDVYFIDQYNQEYSRDIEPMKGGHTDNYYYQLMANVRRYKGVRRPEPPSPPQTIRLQGPFSQWEGIRPAYQDHRFDTTHRNSPGQEGAGPYVNTTGRNDIVRAKVARDAANVYFYAATREAMTPPSGGDQWMLLYIDADQDPSTGRHGYDYRVNGGVQSGGATTLEAFEAGEGWTPHQSLSYQRAGNELMLAVPRPPLGEEAEVAFDFHWSDNTALDGDLSDFFLDGDNAPERRANYRYEAKRTN